MILIFLLFQAYSFSPASDPASWVSNNYAIVYRGKKKSVIARNYWNRLNFSPNGVEIEVSKKGGL
jgi:hypothetical protein